tara:strand:- start:994 stop:1203 length:210 start_codon:yes stop_codon:yes gene_type:complete
MMMNFKDVARPIAGLIAFQPFALFWCWLTDMNYGSTFGLFMIYSTVCFIPIYAAYERLYERVSLSSKTE